MPTSLVEEPWSTFVCVLECVSRAYNLGAVPWPVPSQRTVGILPPQSRFPFHLKHSHRGLRLYCHASVSLTQSVVSPLPCPFQPGSAFGARPLVGGGQRPKFSKC
eukprot:491958-Prymnesium_polylepis.1